MVKIEIGKKEEFQEDTGTLIEKEGKQIAVFNKNGKLFAIDHVCLHKGGPLAEGFVDDNTVTCPWHGWQYNIETGECLTSQGMKLNAYKIFEENEKVFLEL